MPVGDLVDLDILLSTTGDPNDVNNILVTSIPDVPLVLNPGQFTGVPASFFVPAGVAEDHYFVVGVVDATDAIDESDEDNKNTLWNLIALYVHLGKDREAMPLLWSYLRLDPDNQDAATLLDELAAVTLTDMAVLPG